MKVNLAGLLRQAADCIDPDLDRVGYAYMLREVATHAASVRSGENSLAEFAEVYCLEAPKEGEQSK